MTESQLQKVILDYLTVRGHYAVNVMQTSKAGVPDILACIQGVFVGIEVKLTTGTVSALQIHNIKQIQKAGGTGLVAYSTKDVQFMLDSIAAQKTVEAGLYAQLSLQGEDNES